MLSPSSGLVPRSTRTTVNFWSAGFIETRLSDDAAAETERLFRLWLQWWCVQVVQPSCLRALLMHHCLQDLEQTQSQCPSRASGPAPGSPNRCVRASRPPMSPCFRPRWIFISGCESTVLIGVSQWVDLVHRRLCGSSPGAAAPERTSAI